MSCAQATYEAASLVWSADQTVIGPAAVTTTAQADAVLVASEDRNRRSVTVLADPDNPGDVYLVPSRGGSITSGVRVKAGAGFTLNTAAAIYALATVAGCKVYVVAESGHTA